MMGDILNAFPDLRDTFDVFIVRDDHVVERYTATGTRSGDRWATSHRPAAWRSCMVINIFRIKCGRIVEVWLQLMPWSPTQQLTGTSRPPAR